MFHEQANAAIAAVLLGGYLPLFNIFSGEQRIRLAKLPKSIT